MEEKGLDKIVKSLLEWFKKHRRELPWRIENNAYSIWISEIMLQQTKIEAVKKYYERFMKELPTIQKLAEVEEDRLLKLWEGLGYYNRARNLKKAAIEIEEHYQGKMPEEFEELQKLPGIGEYTAGAIASIAFNKKVPAVDGNVLRVLSRVEASKENVLLPETKKKMTEKLKKMMPEEAGIFNEALMELGEIICIPNGVPLCKNCPLQEVCLANKKKMTEEIPVREKKLERKKEDITVFLLYWGEEVAIQKREEKGLLANMYEFPNAKGKMTLQEITEKVQSWNLMSEEIKEVGKHKHVFSHVEWNMIGYEIKIRNKNKKFIWVNAKELEEKYALPTAFAFYKKNK